MSTVFVFIEHFVPQPLRLCFTVRAEERALRTSLDLDENELVVFLGGTFIERAQRYGWLESELQAQFPSRKLKFRNLGWSGDTVFAESRGIFDTPAQGYSRLVEQIKEIKPSIIVLNYGANEAYGGESGLPLFRAQYEKLISDLIATKAKIVLMTPHFESLVPGRNLETRNHQISQYSDAIRDIAHRRSLSVIDLARLDQTMIRAADVSDNGLHFNSLGNQRIAQQVPELWGAQEAVSSIHVDSNKKLSVVGGSAVVLKSSDAVIQLEWKADSLRGGGKTRLQVSGLMAGTYEVLVDGKITGRASAEQLGEGRKGLVTGGRAVAAYEALRAKIIEKDTAYFHRWRPQNVTYLFLFRKHEQGNNANDIQEFDAMTQRFDSEIYQLKQPVVQLIEIRRG